MDRLLTVEELRVLEQYPEVFVRETAQERPQLVSLLSGITERQGLDNKPQPLRLAAAYPF